MIGKNILLGVLICTYQTVFAQSITKQTIKSIYVLYGHHFSTNYIVDSGQNNLIGRKNVFSVEMGLNLDYNITSHLGIRTGISTHFLFLDETGYGISGPVPQGVNDFWIHKYAGGIEYIESVSIGIPVKALYSFYSNGKLNFSFSGGPFIAVYFPASDEMAGGKHY